MEMLDMFLEIVNNGEKDVYENLFMDYKKNEKLLDDILNEENELLLSSEVNNNGGFAITGIQESGSSIVGVACAEDSLESVPEIKIDYLQQLGVVDLLNEHCSWTPVGSHLQFDLPCDLTPEPVVKKQKKVKRDASYLRKRYTEISKRTTSDPLNTTKIKKLIMMFTNHYLKTGEGLWLTKAEIKNLEIFNNGPNISQLCKFVKNGRGGSNSFGSFGPVLEAKDNKFSLHCDYYKFLRQIRKTL